MSQTWPCNDIAKYVIIYYNNQLFSHYPLNSLFGETHFYHNTHETILIYHIIKFANIKLLLKLKVVFLLLQIIEVIAKYLPLHGTTSWTPIMVVILFYFVCDTFMMDIKWTYTHIHISLVWLQISVLARDIR